MLNINENKLAVIAGAALASVSGNRRWSNAIMRAEELLTSGNPYMHYTGDALVILSESGEIYTANGVCQCKAYAGGYPCKHRAAYKLLKRYMATAN